MNITGSAKLAGVIGWPIAHSLSPCMHNHWIDAYGIDAAYVPLPVRPQDFAVVANALKQAGFRGLNVTVPHKEAAFAIADHCDPTAQAAGAANLLIFTSDGIEARNTDTYGLAASLRESLGAEIVRGQAAAIWGAGGMARSAILALSGMGASEVRILNRNKTRAIDLAAELAPLTSAKLIGTGLDSWKDAVQHVTLLVNATSAGMESPSLDLPLDVLPAKAAVFDAVYNPLETGLLKKAKKLGLTTVDGLGLLMHQAVPSFAAFYGIEAKVSPALRTLLEDALRNDS